MICYFIEKYWLYAKLLIKTLVYMINNPQKPKVSLQ